MFVTGSLLNVNCIIVYQKMSVVFLFCPSLVLPRGRSFSLPSVWIELYWHDNVRAETVRTCCAADLKVTEPAVAGRHLIGCPLERVHRTAIFFTCVWAALKRRHGSHEGTAAGGGAGSRNDGWHVQPVRLTQVLYQASLAISILRYLPVAKPTRVLHL